MYYEKLINHEQEIARSEFFGKRSINSSDSSSISTPLIMSIILIMVFLIIHEFSPVSGSYSITGGRRNNYDKDLRLLLEAEIDTKKRYQRICILKIRKLL
jgi:hypothetical protein